MTKVVFWDLGGVVATNNLNEAFPFYGVTYGTQQKEAWKKHRKGETTERQFFAECLKGTGLERKVSELAKKARDKIRTYEDSALQIISDIKKYRAARQGVISNHSVGWGEYVVRDFNLKKYMVPELIVISGNVGMDKSGPTIFVHACSRAGVEPNDALFFDNEPRNVAMARSTGMNAEIYFSSEQARKDLQKYGINLNGGYEKWQKKK